METEKEMLKKLRSEVQKTPTIRTYESDTFEAIRNENIKASDAASSELDKPIEHQNIGLAAQDLEKKRKLLLLSAIALIALVLSSGAGFYFYSYTKNSKIKKMRAEEAAFILKEENRKNSSIKDVWPEINSALLSYLEEATSTEAAIIFKIKDFDNLFSYIKTKESELLSPASKAFNYKTISPFEKISINNVDLYVSDAEAGTLVYSFVDRAYLIVSSNVNKLLALENVLKKK